MRWCEMGQTRYSIFTYFSILSISLYRLLSHVHWGTSRSRHMGMEKETALVFLGMGDTLFTLAEDGIG
jgi:hypothetical protein